MNNKLVADDREDRQMSLAREGSDVTEDIPEMPFLRNVGLVVTYRCQVACPHCILEAGPLRTEEMLLSEAFDWIEQIATYRNHYVKILSLTGGEPFYDIGNLRKMSEFADGRGLLTTAVTNAFWALTLERAIRVLEELPAIKILAISTDVYHQRSIPFERARNAILAAKKLNIPFTVAVCTENEDEPGYRATLRKLNAITEAGSIMTAVTLPVGRALKNLGTPGHRVTEEPPVAACSAGSTPIVFPNGRVIACIGPVIDLPHLHPLVLGNLREESLHDILDRAESNAILHAMRIWGPKKLIAILKEAGLEDRLPKRYIKGSVCNACYDLLADPTLVEFLGRLSVDRDFLRKIAYARLFYLKETRMVESLPELQAPLVMSHPDGLS